MALPAFSNLQALAPISPIPAALRLLGSLAEPLKSIFPEGEVADPAPGAGVGLVSSGLLTPEMLRVTLLAMGTTADAGEVTLAGVMSRMGIPLTANSLAEAHQALARAPGASPLSFALAKTLNLAPSPETLRGLTAVVETRELDIPAALMARVGLDASDSPAALAGALNQAMAQSAHHPSDISNLQKSLIQFAQSANDPSLKSGASALVSHLEGQSLVNQASQQQTQQQGHDTPLYVAIPCQFAAGQSIVEMQFWKRSPRFREDEGSAEETPLRITVRVSPPSLGKVQADLTGCLTGSLSCRLGTEKLATSRLLARHTGALAARLSASGWPNCDVHCRQQTEWPPLWPGGAAATTPRVSIDWKA